MTLDDPAHQNTLQVASRLPLSVPGALPRRAFDLATQLVTQPFSDGVVTKWVQPAAPAIQFLPVCAPSSTTPEPALLLAPDVLDSPRLCEIPHGDLPCLP